MGFVRFILLSSVVEVSLGTHLSGLNFDLGTGLFIVLMDIDSRTRVHVYFIFFAHTDKNFDRTFCELRAVLFKGEAFNRVSVDVFIHIREILI